MKQINFYGASSSLYHTKNDKQLRIECGMIRFESTVTGYHKGGGIEIGDQLQFGHQQPLHNVTEVMECRNHAGKFPNTEDKINGYFKVKCEFLKPIEARI